MLKQTFVTWSPPLIFAVALLYLMLATGLGFDVTTWQAQIAQLEVEAKHIEINRCAALLEKRDD